MKKNKKKIFVLHFPEHQRSIGQSFQSQLPLEDSGKEPYNVYLHVYK